MCEHNFTGVHANWKWASKRSGNTKINLRSVNFPASLAQNWNRFNYLCFTQCKENISANERSGKRIVHKICSEDIETLSEFIMHDTQVKLVADHNMTRRDETIGWIKYADFKSIL